MAKKARQRWDAYRWIAVWLGLLLPVVLLLAPVISGVRVFGGEPTAAFARLEVALLVYPAMLSGAVSGARFFALYAGYAERDVPTDALSPDDAERGAAAAYRPVKDWLWGSLVAALAGALVLVVQVAPTQEGGALERVLFGVFVYVPIAFTIALGWILGALIGTGVSVFLSSALGILVGVKRRRERRGRLTWIVIAVFLPVLLVSAFGAFFVQLPPSALYRDAWLYLAGMPVSGATFALGPVVLWICRIAFWTAGVLFLVLVTIGTPALIERQLEKRASTQVE